MNAGRLRGIHVRTIEILDKVTAHVFVIRSQYLQQNIFLPVSVHKSCMARFLFSHSERKQNKKESILQITYTENESPCNPRVRFISGT